MPTIRTPDDWAQKHRQIGIRHRARSLPDWLRLRLGAPPGESYCDYQVAKRIQQTVPIAEPGQKLLEIGCAPGRHMLRLWWMLGYEPHGVEYTKEGCLKTRQMLRHYGANPDHVYCANVFSYDFLCTHQGHYDVVLSRGFIEEVDDPVKALRVHIGLCKPGGYIIVGIPNLYTWSYRSMRRRTRWLLDAHHLDMMTDLGAFMQVFDGLPLTHTRFWQCGTWQWFGPGGKSRWNSLMHHLCFALLNGYDIPHRRAPQYLLIAQVKG